MKPRRPVFKKNKEHDIVDDAARELELRPLAEVNEYYIDISNKFKMAKFAVLIFLVVFILCMISIFRTDITLENYRYLIRFFTSGNSAYTGSYDAIYYDTAGVVDLELFNGDLVTIKNDGVDFYDMNGSNTVSHDISYVTPKVVTNGKYMLVYDLGGNRFDLFNNFSQLTGESYDSPITCAAVSEEGMYAVVTETKGFKSYIRLYDHNFKNIVNYKKDEYITDIKINSAGDKVIFTSFEPTKDGSYESEIMVYEPRSEEVDGKHELSNTLALMCGFHSGGGYSVLSDNSLMFFDKGNNMISEFELAGIVPNKCLILDKYVVLSYNKNIVGSQSEVVIFSSKGEKLFTSAAEDKILDTAAYEDKLYLLLDSKIVAIDLDDKKQKEADIDSGATGVYVCDKDNLVLGYSNMARAYEVEDLFADKKKEENK